MNKQRKEKKGTTIKAFLLIGFVVIGIIASTAAVSAYRGDFSQEGPNFDVDRHTEMEQAFNTFSYESWYMLMSQNERQGKVMELITEENFNDFAEAHNAGLNGDYEKAASIRAELGLGNGQGQGAQDGLGQKNKGMHKGNGQGMHKGQGNGQGMHQQNSQMNFVDSNNDGNCDNLMY